jgi:hypothetical protein
MYGRTPESVNTRKEVVRVHEEHGSLIHCQNVLAGTIK